MRLTLNMGERIAQYTPDTFYKPGKARGLLSR